MTPPDPRSTRHSGHHFNPLYRVAPYVEHVLDIISHNNRVNLLHQRFKPAIKLGIQHWPRAVLGMSSTYTLLVSYPCLGALVEFFKAMRSLLYLDVMKDLNELSTLGACIVVACGGMALVGVTAVYLSLFEALSKAVLALRWDKPVRHAEFMFKYSRRIFYACGIASLICMVLVWYSGGNVNDVSFEYGVWDAVKDLARSGMELWALRTMLKDLKGEPRTWWGGDNETKADPEKGEGRRGRVWH